MNKFKIAQSLEGYPHHLALFNPPITNVAVESEEVVVYSSSTTLDDPRIIFLISGNRNQMIDTKGIKLIYTGKLVFSDGSSIPLMPDHEWDGETKSDADEEKKRVTNNDSLIKCDVFPVNNLYHSFFKDGCLDIQGKKFYANDIAYRGLLDTIVNNVYDDDNPKMTQLYIPSVFKQKELESIISGSNSNTLDGDALNEYTQASNEIELYGNLPFDVLNQDKYLISHLDMKIELLKHYPEFYLMHSHDKYKYKFIITDVKLCVPFITLRSDLEIAQAETLQNHAAIYNYTEKKVTVHSVASGSHFFETDNTWNQDVPTKLTILMLPSKNYYGSYKLNPFHFKHNNIKTAEIKVDNKCVGGNVKSFKITEKEETSHINDAFCTLIENYPEMKMKREYWLNNFPAIIFNINRKTEKDVLPLITKGLTKVHLSFAKALEEDTIVLLFAEFPVLMEIDGARNITI